MTATTLAADARALLHFDADQLFTDSQRHAYTESEDVDAKT